MERYIFDENNGLWYELLGDYYLPMVTVQQMDAERIGIWGERRRRFLREHMKVTYNGMLLTGKLEEHLIKVNEVAEEMFDLLVKQMAANEGITETLKAENQMVWVQSMNNIRARAAEIVREELIYV